eukprot:SAG11_NODE_239_length_11783_cov_52.724923_1_plen_47_part_10
MASCRLRPKRIDHVLQCGGAGGPIAAAVVTAAAARLLHPDALLPGLG